MKQKTIDLTSLKDMEAIKQLLDLLLDLNINSADCLLSEVDDSIRYNFCDSCTNHEENCECDKDYSYGREYDDFHDYEIDYSESASDSESDKNTI